LFLEILPRNRGLSGKLEAHEPEQGGDWIPLNAPPRERGGDGVGYEAAGTALEDRGD
jgi:hypothetical protein